MYCYANLLNSKTDCSNLIDWIIASKLRSIKVTFTNQSSCSDEENLSNCFSKTNSISVWREEKVSYPLRPLIVLKKLIG